MRDFETAADMFEAPGTGCLPAWSMQMVNSSRGFVDLGYMGGYSLYYDLSIAIQELSLAWGRFTGRHEGTNKHGSISFPQSVPV